MGKYRRLIIKRRSEKCRNCIHNIYDDSYGDSCFCDLDPGFNPPERHLDDPACDKFDAVYCHKCRAWAGGEYLLGSIRRRKDGYSFGCNDFVWPGGDIGDDMILLYFISNALYMKL